MMWKHKKSINYFGCFIVLLSCMSPAVGCGQKADDGTAPKELEGKLPAVELRDDTVNLMLTWIDSKGETHVELHPGDVPVEGKALVRVVLTDRTDGTGELFYVADLTQKGEGGVYSVKTMPRRLWESTISSRREEYLAKIAPPPPPLPEGSQGGSGPVVPAPPATPGQLQGNAMVTIYGADWCQPCHQAEDYLKRKGIAYVKKNIEKDSGAESEMRALLAKAGMRGGTIPVIQVGGQVLVGFSERALAQAIAKLKPQAGAGTVL